MTKEIQNIIETELKEFEKTFWDKIGTETDPDGTPNMYLIRNEKGEVKNGIDFSDELQEIKSSLRSSYLRLLEQVRLELTEKIKKELTERVYYFSPPVSCKREKCTACPEMHGRADGFRRALKDVLSILETI